MIPFTYLQDFLLFNKEMLHFNLFLMKLQYIQPHEHEKLSQVELLVVDEAAAIPLPVVKSLLGPYLVFLSSTVNGYEICCLHSLFCLKISSS